MPSAISSSRVSIVLVSMGWVLGEIAGGSPPAGDPPGAPLGWSRGNGARPALAGAKRRTRARMRAQTYQRTMREYGGERDATLVPVRAAGAAVGVFDQAAPPACAPRAMGAPGGHG